jgi:hypothetical protein
MKVLLVLDRFQARGLPFFLFNHHNHAVDICFSLFLSFFLLSIFYFIYFTKNILHFFMFCFEQVQRYILSRDPKARVGNLLKANNQSGILTPAEGYFYFETYIFFLFVWVVPE